MVKSTTAKMAQVDDSSIFPASLDIMVQERIKEVRVSPRTPRKFDGFTDGSPQPRRKDNTDGAANELVSESCSSTFIPECRRGRPVGIHEDNFANIEELNHMTEVHRNYRPSSRSPSNAATPVPSPKPERKNAGNGSRSRRSSTDSLEGRDTVGELNHKTQGHSVFGSALNAVKKLGNIPLKIGDKFSAAVNSMEDRILHMPIVGRPVSIEMPPDNNIHVPHPRKGNSSFISLGMHIKKHNHGVEIANLMKGSIAQCTRKLCVGDIITHIDGLSLEVFNLGTIFTHFAEIDTSKSFTLTVLRAYEVGDEVILYELSITITIIAIDDHVSMELEVLVEKVSMFKFAKSVKGQVVMQEKGGGFKYTKYLSVGDEDMKMDAYDEERCVFDIDLYQPGIGRPCIIRSANWGEQVAVDWNSSTFKTSCTAPSGSIVNASSQFFYWKTIDNYSVFECVTKTGHYLTVSENGKFDLQRFDSSQTVPSSGRFRVLENSSFDPPTESDDESEGEFDEEHPKNKFERGTWKTQGVYRKNEL